MTEEKKNPIVRSWLSPDEVQDMVEKSGVEGVYAVASVIALQHSGEQADGLPIRSAVPYEYVLSLIEEFRAYSREQGLDLRMPVSVMDGIIVIGQENGEWPELPEDPETEFKRDDELAKRGFESLPQPKDESDK